MDAATMIREEEVLFGKIIEREVVNLMLGALAGHSIFLDKEEYKAHQSKRVEDLDGIEPQWLTIVPFSCHTSGSPGEVHRAVAWIKADWRRTNKIEPVRCVVYNRQTAFEVLRVDFDPKTCLVTNKEVKPLLKSMGGRL